MGEEYKFKKFVELFRMNEVLDYENGFVENMEYLIKTDRENVDIKLEMDSTPWHWVCVYYDVKEGMMRMMQMLIDEKLEFVLMSKNYHGKTPLHYLCANYKQDNLEEIIKMLTLNGIDMDVQNRHGETPIHYFMNRRIHRMEIGLLLVQEAWFNINSLPEWWRLEKANTTQCTAYGYYSCVDTDRKRNYCDWKEIVEARRHRNSGYVHNNDYRIRYDSYSIKDGKYISKNYYYDKNIFSIIKVLMNANINMGIKNDEGETAIQKIRNKRIQKLVIKEML
jgi:hypothetical protein